MDFAEKIQQIALKAENNIANITTEEASKQSLVLPMLQALGYDVFNPSEVTPEYIADVGMKKGEKVDYAIKKGDEMIMLIECKAVDSKLGDDNLSQLYRYFGVSEAHFGVLTNGVIYKFYSDLNEPNKMDAHPFFEFDLLNYRKKDLRELKKFAKEAFELETILATAQNLQWHNAILAEIETEFTNPSDDLVKLLGKRVYEGVMRKNTVDDFRDIIPKAFDELIHTRIDETLQSAMHRRVDEDVSDDVLEAEQVSADANEDNGIITTEEEKQGHLIVTAIASKVVKPERVTLRDAKSYCAILLDDNNRKPICRLHFNHSQWYVGIVENKQEQRHPIGELSEIYQWADKMIEIILGYEK